MLPQQLHPLVVRMHAAGYAAPGSGNEVSLVLHPEQNEALTQHLAHARSAPELRALRLQLAHPLPHEAATCNMAGMYARRASLPRNFDSDHSGSEDDAAEPEESDYDTELCLRKHNADVAGGAETPAATLWATVAALTQLTSLAMHMPQQLIGSQIAAMSALPSLQELLLNVEGNFAGQLPAALAEQHAAIVRSLHGCAAMMHLSLKGACNTVQAPISLLHLGFCLSPCGHAAHEQKEL